MTAHALRITLQFVAVLLTTYLVVLAFRIVRRLHRQDAASLSASMFLEASRVRRFVVVLALSVLFFVTMPLAILGYLLTDAVMLELVHDLSHIAFLTVVLGGLVGIDGLARRAGARDPGELRRREHGHPAPAADAFVVVDLEARRPGH